MEGVGSFVSGAIISRLFSSPEPKVSVPFSGRCGCWRRCGINFSHFCVIQKNEANFNQTWHKAFLGDGDSSLFKWRTLPFSKGRLLQNCENTLTNYKIFSRETGPISTKLGTNHPLIKGIEGGFLDEGPLLFPRVYN